MIRSAPSISTTGRARAARACGSRAGRRPRGPRAAARRARGRGPSRRRRCGSRACRVRRRGASRCSPSHRAGTGGSSSSSRTGSMLPRRSGCPRCASSAGCSCSRRFNAFFKHGEAQLFLARRDGRVVGRISAQIDHAYNAFHGSRWGMFGFLECEDDPEAADALLGGRRGLAAASASATAWSGRWTSRMNDESGDPRSRATTATPMIRQPWHPPYYRELCEEAGLEQGDGPADVAAGDRRPREDPARHRRARRAACEPEHGDPPAARCRGARCAATWTSSPRSTTRPGRATGASSPYDKEDLDAYAQELQLVFDPRLVHGRREDGTGETVGDRDHRARTSTRC